jgi:NADP-dependent 3-hydroxy acid dehydrogenase YdfG
MVGLKGKLVCLSNNGRGGIGGALCQELQRIGAILVSDVEAPPAVDFAICTAGKMLIRDAGSINEFEIEDLYKANYKYPRLFTERHIQAMKATKKGGLILHIGSNAARYGNTGADDYAAFKAALAKYLELRGRSVRQYGIRLSVLNLGGVNTGFWQKVAQTADMELAKGIMPDPEKALTVQEVAAVVLAVLQMPERVVIKDAVVVSVDYQ